MFFQALCYFGRLRTPHTSPRIHDDIDGRQHVLMLSERFSNQTLQSISTHGVSNKSGRHGKS
jgi:hypothetical protein